MATTAVALPRAGRAFDSFPRALGPPGPVGCRLQAFTAAWAAITDDKLVLSVVRNGFVIGLMNPLPGGALRSPTKAGSHRFRAEISLEIAALIKKRAIERVVDHPRMCLSPIFTVPKRSGKVRMILNLKLLNQFIQPVSFRMENLATILPLLRRGDWAVSIDLSDAYHHIPIAKPSRRLLGFEFAGRVYQFRALPFGLRPAPRLFSRLVSVVAAFLRERGIRIFCYLDDWLIVADDPVRLTSHRDFTLQVVQGLGFLINWDKSSLHPTQHPVFLGAVLDLTGLVARPTPERVSTILAAARVLRQKRKASARSWMRFLGYLASLVDVLPDCRLHMRLLQIHLLRYHRPNVDPLTGPVPMTEAIRLQIARWQRRPFLTQGKPFTSPQPTITVSTDASLLGWGGVCGERMVSGDWEQLPYLPHINHLEFLAVQLTCRQLLPILSGKSVMIQTDNVTVAAYINKQGGTHSIRLNQVAMQFWEWCHVHTIVPTATYLPGQDNFVADFLSRGKTLPSEWTLNPAVMVQVLEMSGPLQVDLFASSLNHQLPIYCSRAKDPKAWKIDAFSFSWSGIKAYAFPPFSLIPRVLRKIRDDQASVLLIAPWWPKRPWFLEMVELLTKEPRMLPVRPDLLLQPLSLLKHHNPALLRLTVWPLSGRMAGKRASPAGLQSLSLAAIDPRQGNPITHV